MGSQMQRSTLGSVVLCKNVCFLSKVRICNWDRFCPPLPAWGPLATCGNMVLGLCHSFKGRGLPPSLLFQNQVKMEVYGENAKVLWKQSPDRTYGLRKPPGIRVPSALCHLYLRFVSQKMTFFSTVLHIV